MTVTAVVLALDLLGIFAFAVNGALTSARKVRLDIVGILTLGMVTAVGGGMLRDVLIGAIPPLAFTYWPYLAVAAAGSMIAFFISRPPRFLNRAILVLDAAGLSLFCVAGAYRALNFGLDPGPAIVLGAVPGVVAAVLGAGCGGFAAYGTLPCGHPALLRLGFPVGNEELGYP